MKRKAQSKQDKEDSRKNPQKITVQPLNFMIITTQGRAIKK
jgi:hypothetical protein